MIEKSLTMKRHGLLVKQLDTVLQSVNVQRQAYHGKSFIGNDVVYKMLKVLWGLFKIQKFLIQLNLMMSKKYQIKITFGCTISLKFKVLGSKHNQIVSQHTDPCKWDGIH